MLSLVPALTDAGRFTTITTYANAWDTRATGNGCSPSGCVPQNTRDGEILPESRWSCKEDLPDDNCELLFTFGEPVDVEQIRIAFYNGDERTRSLKIWVNGKPYTKVQSRGETRGFEDFTLDATAVRSIMLEGLSMEGDEWISITEVSEQ